MTTPRDCLVLSRTLPGGYCAPGRSTNAASFSWRDTYTPSPSNVNYASSLSPIDHRYRFHRTFSHSCLSHSLSDQKQILKGNICSLSPAHARLIWKYPASDSRISTSIDTRYQSQHSAKNKVLQCKGMLDINRNRVRSLSATDHTSESHSFQSHKISKQINNINSTDTNFMLYATSQYEDFQKNEIGYSDHHSHSGASFSQLSLPTLIINKNNEEREVLLSKLPAVEVVARRNERERNRVKLINFTFAVLRDHLPQDNKSNNNRKLSKVETLRAAIEYIRDLHAMISKRRLQRNSFMTLGTTAASFDISQNSRISDMPLEDKADDNNGGENCLMTRNSLTTSISQSSSSISKPLFSSGLAHHVGNSPTMESRCPNVEPLNADDNPLDFDNAWF